MKGQMIQRVTENQVHKFKASLSLGSFCYVVRLNLKINKKINSGRGATLLTEKYIKDRYSGLYPLD